MENENLKIPWSGKSVVYTDNQIRTVVNAMKDADPLTQGKYLREFENKFSKYLGVKNSFAVSSGTAALELSAILSGLKKGDEVIMPAHTFCATAIPFARAGVKIIWADIDKDTRVISAEKIKSNITDKTKAIVVVHLYGFMADMEKIIKLAKEKELIVIEDCAQALGAERAGRKAGSYGDFSCFSFHGAKNITTLGEGGMIIVKSEEKAKLVPGLRHNGIKPYPETREKFWEPAMSDVDFDIDNFWPYNFCIGEVQCALGTEMLKTVETDNKKRINRAKKFISALKDFPEISFQETNIYGEHVYHLLSAKYDGNQYRKNRNDLMELMTQKYLIKTTVQYYPLYRYPMFKKAGFGEAKCPNTDDFYDNMISFPFHLWMSDSDFKYMGESTKKALKELRRENV